MERIITFFRSETIYFSHQIANNIRRIMLSNTYHTVSSALVSIFLGAFIWRSTGSLLPVLIYKLGERIFLPIAFYINGLLLRRVSIRLTYMIGSLALGIASALLVFIGPKELWTLFIFGCLWGIGNGLYYGNRNYLELKEIDTSIRQYFFGLTSSISHTTSILVPFIAGWFITIGEITNWYLPVHAYWIVFTIALFMMIKCALVIRHGTFESPIPNQLLRFNVRPVFNPRRLLLMGQGFSDGVTFLTGILVLYMFGGEGVLGTVTAIVAIISILSTYTYGRVADKSKRYRNLLISSLSYVACAIVLAFAPGNYGAMIYILLMGLASTFFCMISGPIILDHSENELVDPGERYSFIVDNEIFLNIGRLIAMVILIALTIFASQRTGMFYGPLFAALLQLCILVIVIRKNKTVN